MFPLPVLTVLTLLTVQVITDKAIYLGDFHCYRGHVLAQLDEARRFKSEGRGFDSRWCHWNFSLTILPGGPGSSVGIATDYRLDGPGIESR
jgi:hypothetical protein